MYIHLILSITSEDNFLLQITVGNTSRNFFNHLIMCLISYHVYYFVFISINYFIKNWK